jgi:hypothetical protein
MVRHRILTKLIVLTEYSSTYCLYHYNNHVRGADGSRVSSVIIVTRIQAVGNPSNERGFSLLLSLQIGTEAHIDCCWMGPADKAAGVSN